MKNFIIAISLLFTSFQAFAQDPHNDIAVNFKVVGAPIPNFLLKSEDGTLFTNKDFKSSKYLLLMMFNPMCGHCDMATDSIKVHLDEFKKAKILLFVYPNHEADMPLFNKNHDITNYPQMLVGADSFKVTDRLFTYQGLPQINIYNKDRKLIKIFQGDIFIDSLKAYIK